MEFQIPINTLFTQVFGIAYPMIKRFEIPGEPKAPEGVLFKVGEIITEEDYDLVYSSLNTPVHFWMGFDGGDYLKREQGVLKKVFRKGMYLPFTSVATIGQAKRWEETPMSGQEGAVIEEYGFEPWDIRIQGFIIKNDQERVTGKSSVEDQVKELLSYWKLSDSVKVKGKIFEWLDIHRVAIHRINFPEARQLDMNVVKPYEIVMRSVEPLELIAL